MVQWKIENPDYHNDFIRNNPDKAKMHIDNKEKRSHKLSPKEWKACKLYFNYCCAYCGKPEEIQREQNNEDFHKEHVDDQGVNNLSNCVPSCTNCNCQKWTFDMEDWYRRNESIFNEIRFNKILEWLNFDHKKYIEVKKEKK